MASVEAFNQTLDEFLSDLSDAFPEEKQFKKLKLKLKKDTTIMPRAALDAIVPELTKYTQRITARDVTLFNEPNIIPDITNLAELYESTSEQNRKVIWDYLSTLLMLGTTIRTIPGNMLSQIEGIAQTCVDQIQNNSSGMGGMENIFQLAQQTIFNNGDFQNMLSGLGGNMNMTPPPQNNYTTEIPTPSMIEYNNTETSSKGKKNKKKNKNKHK